MSRGLKLRARARRIAAVTVVAAVVVASGGAPLVSAAETAVEEPPAVDIPLFGQPKAKAKTPAPKAKKPAPAKEPAPKAKEPTPPEASEASEASEGAGAGAAKGDAKSELEPEVKPAGAGEPEPGEAAANGPGEDGPSAEPGGEALGEPDGPALDAGPDAGPDPIAGGAAADEASAAALGAPGGEERPAEAAPVGQSAASEEPPAPANDGPVTVTTKVSPDPSFVGDRLTLEIIAAYPKGYRVNLPTGVDFSPLHLVSIEEGEPEPSAEGYFRKVFTVTLQHFDVGESKVPGFPLTYVGKDGEVETVRVAPRPFLVDSLLANEADPERKLEDPPISLEYPNTTAELVIYSAAVAMLAGFFLALFWRRFASRRKVVVGPPPVPAHEIALSALDELEQSEFLETGLVQDYYLELTEIAKGYLEGRFGVDALDRTTDEIRRDLVRHRDRIKPLEPDDVLRFLEGCDLVKFARFDPELEEARSALSEVRTMVEETVPTANPSGTGEAGAGPEPGEPASAEADAEEVATTASSSSPSSSPSSPSSSSPSGSSQAADGSTEPSGSARGEVSRADVEGTEGAAAEGDRAEAATAPERSASAEARAPAPAPASSPAAGQGSGGPGQASAETGPVDADAREGAATSTDPASGDGEAKR